MDTYIAEYVKAKDSYVLDYRLGFHFLLESFKVLLKVSDDTALKRMANRNRNQKMRTRFIEI